MLYWLKLIPCRLISCPEGPEIYSASLSYPSSFQPIQIPRRHPPPLAQRERSTSAPNVCYNMVGTQSGMDSTLEDWSYRIKVQNLAATGTVDISSFAWLSTTCMNTISFIDDIGCYFVPNFYYIAYIIIYYLINQNNARNLIFCAVCWFVFFSFRLPVAIDVEPKSTIQTKP